MQILFEDNRNGDGNSRLKWLLAKEATGVVFLINLKQELHNYSPIDLKKLAENNADIPDSVKNSILLYNKALDSLRMDSEDIAIIELKKAISMNPSFYQAMNLLGVCYFYTKDYSKAYMMFEKVIAGEGNSIRAMNYLNLMSSEDGAKIPSTKSKEPAKRAEIQEEKESLKEIFIMALRRSIDFRAFAAKDYLKYIVGFLFGIVVVTVIMVYANVGVSGKAVKADKAPLEPNPATNALKEEYEHKLGKLSDDYSSIRKELDQASEELEYYRNVSKLSEIEKLIAARNFEAAADKLVMLKTINFKETERDKYNSLYKDAVPRAAWAVFSEGSNLFYSKRYQDALVKLGKVPVYGTDWAYMDITLYYIGVCYKELGDAKNATTTLNRLKETYPASQYSVYADYRLKELQTH